MLICDHISSKNISGILISNTDMSKSHQFGTTIRSQETNYRSNQFHHIPIHCEVFLFFAQGSLPTIAATLMGLMPGKFAR